MYAGHHYEVGTDRIITTDGYTLFDLFGNCQELQLSQLFKARLIIFVELHFVKTRLAEMKGSGGGGAGDEIGWEERNCTIAKFSNRNKFYGKLSSDIITFSLERLIFRMRGETYF